MPPQELINLVALAGFGVTGWFAREMWNAVKDLKQDLSRLREELPKTYLPKHEARELMHDLQKEMRDNFARLFDRLDQKADKQ